MSVSAWLWCVCGCSRHRHVSRRCICRCWQSSLRTRLACSPRTVQHRCLVWQSTVTRCLLICRVDAARRLALTPVRYHWTRLHWRLVCRLSRSNDRLYGIPMCSVSSQAKVSLYGHIACEWYHITGAALPANPRPRQTDLSYPACITLTHARQPNLSSASACVASWFDIDPL